MSYSALPAEALFRACASSHPEAWEEFRSRFHELITRVASKTAARWTTVSPGLRDDLVQEVYAKLLVDECRLLQTFRAESPDSAFSFLKVIAARVVSDHFRSERALRRHPIQAARVDPDVASVAGERGAGSMTEVERNILIQQIDSCLERCTSEPTRERDRNIFWLYYRQGLSAHAIASIPSMGLTVKGVETVLHRLTKSIRSQLVSETKQVPFSSVKRGSSPENVLRKE